MAKVPSRKRCWRAREKGPRLFDGTRGPAGTARKGKRLITNERPRAHRRVSNRKPSRKHRGDPGQRPNSPFATTWTVNYSVACCRGGPGRRSSLLLCCCCCCAYAHAELTAVRRTVVHWKQGKEGKDAWEPARSLPARAAASSTGRRWELRAYTAAAQRAMSRCGIALSPDLPHLRCPFRCAPQRSGRQKTKVSLRRPIMPLQTALLSDQASGNEVTRRLCERKPVKQEKKKITEVGYATSETKVNVSSLKQRRLLGTCS